MQNVTFLFTEDLGGFKNGFLEFTKLFKVFVMINVQLLLFLVERVFSFKGYLHYKTITSQNVLSEVRLRSILFCRKVMFHILDVLVFFCFFLPSHVLPNL